MIYTGDSVKTSNYIPLPLGAYPDDRLTIADFMTVIHPRVAPNERKARENAAVFSGLTVGRERHVTRGGKGVVGRLGK